MLRVQANFQLPYQMRLNTLINLQSGRPYNRQSQVPTFNRPDVVVEPAGGDLRHDTQTIWDLGFGKQFNLGGSVALQLDLQLLNVLNKTPVDYWETVVLAEGDTYVPNWWVKPRRLQLHIGIEF
jgi:hypothetical protein